MKHDTALQETPQRTKRFSVITELPTKYPNIELTLTRVTKTGRKEASPREASGEAPAICI